MNTLVEQLDTLATRGTPRGADGVYHAATRDLTLARRPRATLAFAVGFAVVAIAVGLTVLGGNGRTDAGRTSLVPVETLPALDGPPMTVASGSDLSYMSYTDDLYLAWRATPDSSTELCWQTPRDSDCVSDLFFAPDVVVIPVAEQAIVLTRPPLTGPQPTEVAVELSSGATISAPLQRVGGIALVYARIALSDSDQVVSAAAR